MPPRRVFGKNARTKYDAFAAMLQSSPELNKHHDTCNKPHATPDPDSWASKPSDKIPVMSVLREISANQPSTATVPQDKSYKSQKPRRLPQMVVRKAKETEQSRASKSRADDSVVGTKQKNGDLLLTQQSVQIPRQKPAVMKNHDETSTHLGQSRAKDAQIDQDCWHAHCRPILDLCDTRVISFDAWSNTINAHLYIDKIAEASFGEVYRLSSKKNDVPFTCLEESVLKIIPITPPEAALPKTTRNRERRLKKAELMSRPEDVASEVKLLQRMTSIPGFINFRDVRVLKGRPSIPFINAYKEYNKKQKETGKELSHFPHPAMKNSYPEDQLWAVIEMEDAGTDLERELLWRQYDIWQTWDIFWRTTLALAKGEKSAEFEHRDLHLGNICVRGQDDCKDDAMDTDRRLGFTNIDITLIDYTISRASIAGQEKVAYTDLETDQHIFVGDSSKEYQYDIYRYMRSALFLDDALATVDAAQIPDTGRSWSQFQPQTNIVWLHYVLHMLMTKLNRTSMSPAPRRCDGQAACAEYRRAIELKQILLRTQQLLDPKAVIKNGIRSAGDLVTLALSNDWLYSEDVIGEERSVMQLVDDMINVRL